MNVIEVDGVSKMFRLGAGGGDLRERFGALLSRRGPEARAAAEFWALRDISFRVAEGESFGIIGHNGSGKSTLLKLITGIYKPTAGTFKTRGRIAALIEVGAGFHQDLTGRENVYLNGSVMGMRRREIDRRFDEIVAFSELEKFIDTPVKRYSSGMYMRLGFSVAAHIDPDIVLVDEVLAVGDEAFQAKCMKRMHELRREGKTIVFISHSMDAVASLCQRVMLLSHGQMLTEGAPPDVITAYRSSLSADRHSRGAAPSDLPDAGTAHRKVLEVLGARLVDKDGNPCSTFEMGEAIRLDCTYRSNSRVDDLALGINVVREDGLYLSGFNTVFDGLTLDPLEGEGAFSLTFTSLQLLQGAYYFNVGLCHTDDTQHPVDFVVRAAQFTITGKSLVQGVIEMPHSWHVEAAPAVAFDPPKTTAPALAG